MGCPRHQKTGDAASAEAAASAAPAAGAGPRRCPHSGAILPDKPADTSGAAAAAEKKCPYASGNSSASAAGGAAPGTAGLAASEAAAMAAASGAGAGDVAAGFSSAASAALKDHFVAAYNTVAAAVADAPLDAARVAENVRVSAVLTERLGYSRAQLGVVGDDVWKMQGTGNPHSLALLAAGERVVDLGSGFGIDAFLAASVVGETGHVVGVDLAEGEVFQAVRRAAQRRLRSVDFRIGDIEHLPVASGSMDCAISNGGFCLAVQKKAAFAEVFRVLRPGGRMSISCTASREPLDPAVKWPTCMLVFLPLWSATEILEAVGFVDVVVREDTGDAWKAAGGADDGKTNPADAAAPGAAAGRVTVHRGDGAYDHLKGMDMDRRFPRVNVFARKP